MSGEQTQTISTGSSIDARTRTDQDIIIATIKSFLEGKFYMPTIKTVEGILYTLGVFLVMLIALYGVSHLIITYSPSPISGWFSKAVSYSTPAGWSNA